MFRLSFLSVTFLLSVLIAPVSSQADDRPVPPADPKSQETAESSAARQPLKEAGGSSFMLLVSLEELRKSLQQEHDKNEALALELATARANMYAYEAQAHRASDEVADLKQAAEVSADGLRKSLQQEQERAVRLEQDLAAARRDVETQTALAAKASDDASRAKQAAGDTAAELRKSLQLEQERAVRLEQDLAAARRDVRTQTALASKASDDSSRQKQAAEQGSAELKQSLQKEHERAEVLAKDLSMAHATIYAYEAQTPKASDQATNSQQVSENDAAALRKSLKQEQDRAGPLEQDLAAARRDVETQTALAAKAGAEAARLKQAAADQAARYRQLAEQADDPVIKNEMLELASVCEEVANNIEDHLTGV